MRCMVKYPNCLAMIPYRLSDYLKIIYAQVHAIANNLELNLLLGDVSNLWPQVFPSPHNYVAYSLH